MLQVRSLLSVNTEHCVWSKKETVCVNNKYMYLLITTSQMFFSPVMMFHTKFAA